MDTPKESEIGNSEEKQQSDKRKLAVLIKGGKKFICRLAEQSEVDGTGEGSAKKCKFKVIGRIDDKSADESDGQQTSTHDVPKSTSEGQTHDIGVIKRDIELSVCPKAKSVANCALAKRSAERAVKLKQLKEELWELEQKSPSKKTTTAIKESRVDEEKTKKSNHYKFFNEGKLAASVEDTAAVSGNPRFKQSLDAKAPSKPRDGIRKRNARFQGVTDSSDDEDPEKGVKIDEQFFQIFDEKIHEGWNKQRDPDWLPTRGAYLPEKSFRFVMPPEDWSKIASDNRCTKLAAGYGAYFKYQIRPFNKACAFIARGNKTNRNAWMNSFDKRSGEFRCQVWGRANFACSVPGCTLEYQGVIRRLPTKAHRGCMVSLTSRGKFDHSQVDQADLLFHYDDITAGIQNGPEDVNNDIVEEVSMPPIGQTSYVPQTNQPIKFVMGVQDWGAMCPTKMEIFKQKMNSDAKRAFHWSEILIRYVEIFYPCPLVVYRYYMKKKESQIKPTIPWFKLLLKCRYKHCTRHYRVSIKKVTDCDVPCTIVVVPGGDENHTGDEPPPLVRYRDRYGSYHSVPEDSVPHRTYDLPEGEISIPSLLTQPLQIRTPVVYSPPPNLQQHTVIDHRAQQGLDLVAYAESRYATNASESKAVAPRTGRLKKKTLDDEIRLMNGEDQYFYDNTTINTPFTGGTANQIRYSVSVCPRKSKASPKKRVSSVDSNSAAKRKKLEKVTLQANEQSPSRNVEREELAQRWIESWDKRDVGQWLKLNQLKALKVLLKDYDGNMLFQLYNLHMNSPNAFHDHVRQELQLKLTDLLKFTHAFTDMNGYITGRKPEVLLLG